jgi:hypothetical protein
VLPLAILDALVMARRRSALQPGAEAASANAHSVTAWSDDVFK